jgi:branched-chain amino acid transport system permease protein
MELLVSVVASGLLVGAVYGLFSVGLSLSFGVLRLVNFAHGDLVMFGMYAAAAFVGATSLSIYFAIPIVALAAIPFGVIIYVVFFRGTGKKSEYDQLVISLGLALLLETVAVNLFGYNSKALGALSVSSISIGWLHLSQPELIAFVVSLGVTAVLVFVLRRTAIGRSVRAVVADREVAVLVGINERLVFTGTFVASVVLAGIAGVVLYGFQPVTPQTGSDFILLSFIVVVLGGIGDVQGTFVAGLLVGVVENLTATYGNTSIQDIAIYALFVLVIVLRPNGLFGRSTL